MKQSEFEELLADTTKRIRGNIIWREDKIHSPAVVFRIEITSEIGYPLFVEGRYHHMAQKLTYAIVHRSFGRIYGLDMGREHRNPSGNKIGRTHKHRWQEEAAYVPEDITAPVTDPVAVWQQFCIESRITHDGVMHAPPFQLELL